MERKPKQLMVKALRVIRHGIMTAKGSQQTSEICSPRMIPRDQFADPALLVAVDDGGERGCQIPGRWTRLLPEGW